MSPARSFHCRGAADKALFLATDSSSPGYGRVVAGAARCRGEVRCGAAVRRGGRQAPIYWKETQTAILALGDVGAVAVESGVTCAGIAGDNAAAEVARGKSYSSKLELRNPLLKAHEIPEARDIALVVIGVALQEQAADEPSRGGPLSE